MVNILPGNTGDGQMKISVTQKPNSSPIFTGRKDVLDKLGKIFVHHTTSISWCSCLLWGPGGIGKTQIALKFIEEMSDK
jgi:replication-associated recombination protein RarA